eukprot:2823280-Alexandrium_andersonii.AAC.1
MCGHTVFMHTKLSRINGASGNHVIAMSFGRKEGDAPGKNMVFMLQCDEADGPYIRQVWDGAARVFPIFTGGMCPSGTITN